MTNMQNLCFDYFSPCSTPSVLCSALLYYSPLIAEQKNMNIQACKNKQKK